LGIEVIPCRHNINRRKPITIFGQCCIKRNKFQIPPSLQATGTGGLIGVEPPVAKPLPPLVYRSGDENTQAF
jgi:hypothetical protein